MEWAADHLLRWVEWDVASRSSDKFRIYLVDRIPIGVLLLRVSSLLRQLPVSPPRMLLLLPRREMLVPLTLKLPL